MSMRGFVVTLLMTAFAATPVVAKAQARQAGTSKADVEAAIHKLEQVYVDARLHGDTAALRKLFSDDYVAIGANGAITDKAGILKAPDKTTAGDKFTAVEHGQVTVRVFGSTAIATGLRKITTEKSSNSTRFTHVFIDRGNGWQLVSSQTTQVAN